MAENKRDYYEVLGVSKTAADADIKKAYRKLAKENHPDLHPGDQAAEAQFKEINEAYEILSNSDKRSRYDQFGFAGVDPNYAAQQGGGFGGGFDGGFDFGDLGDIFGSFFGGGFGGARSRTGPQRGESLRTGLTITFEEAAFGCEKEVALERVEQCPDCKGSGAAPGTSPETCSNCGGSGAVQQRRQTPMGVFATTGPCPRCGGKGKTISSPCKSCGGTGQIRKRKTVKVSIPAGIDNGQIISLRGQGNAGKNGGPPGTFRLWCPSSPTSSSAGTGPTCTATRPLPSPRRCWAGTWRFPPSTARCPTPCRRGPRPGPPSASRARAFPTSTAGAGATSSSPSTLRRPGASAGSRRRPCGSSAKL